MWDIMLLQQHGAVSLTEREQAGQSPGKEPEALMSSSETKFTYQAGLVGGIRRFFQRFSRHVLHSITLSPCLHSSEKRIDPRGACVLEACNLLLLSTAFGWRSIPFEEKLAKETWEGSHIVRDSVHILLIKGLQSFLYSNIKICHKFVS